MPWGAAAAGGGVRRSTLTPSTPAQILAALATTGKGTRSTPTPPLRAGVSNAPTHLKGQRQRMRMLVERTQSPATRNRLMAKQQEPEGKRRQLHHTSIEVRVGKKKTDVTIASVVVRLNQHRLRRCSAQSSHHRLSRCLAQSSHGPINPSRIPGGVSGGSGEAKGN